MNVGDPNSSQRKAVYDQVIGPLNQVAKALGKAPVSSKGAWKALPRVQADTTWQQVLYLAKDLRAAFGLSFNSMSMATLPAAKSVAQGLKTALATGAAASSSTSSSSTSSSSFDGLIGVAGSDRRTRFYNQVVGPINQMARDRGMTPTAGRGTWIAGTGDAIGQHWEAVKTLMRGLGAKAGMEPGAPALTTFPGAKSWVQRVKAALAAQGVEIGEEASTQDELLVGGSTVDEPLTVESDIFAAEYDSALAVGAEEDAGMSLGTKIGIGVGIAAALGAAAFGIKALRQRTTT